MAEAQKIEAANPETHNQHKNEKVGEVVSTKMQKTIVVQVSRRVPHPLYRRIVMKHKKFYAHYEENTARVGDVVPDRGMPPDEQVKSRWRLGDVIRRSALRQWRSLPISTSRSNAASGRWCERI